MGPRPGDRAAPTSPDALSGCLSASAEGAVLAVRVTPNASRTEWRGTRDGRALVRLRAPPVEGRANEALLEWIASEFGLRARDVRLLRGTRSREKSVVLQGLDVSEALARSPAGLAREAAD